MRYKLRIDRITRFFHSFSRLKSHIQILICVYRNTKTPIYAKAWLIFVLAYAISPIDIIPDYLPIIGYLDDIILLAIGIYIATRLIPDHIIEECRETTTFLEDKRLQGLQWLGTIAIILFWGLSLGVLFCVLL